MNSLGLVPCCPLDTIAQRSVCRPRNDCHRTVTQVQYFCHRQRAIDRPATIRELSMAVASGAANGEEMAPVAAVALAD
jgi:hypothetical protein